MSATDTVGVLPERPVEAPLSMRELAEVLVKHYGLHQGCYTLIVEFQVGTGAVGPTRESTVPGAMIGVAKVGLMPTTEAGPTTIDASVVNPAKKPRKKVAK